MTAFLIAAMALAGYFLAFYMAFHALLHKTDPQAALGWVAFIILVPYVGTISYLLFGLSRVDSHAATLIDRAAQEQLQADSALDLSIVPPHPPHLPGEDVPASHMVVNVGQRLTGKDPLGGNKLTLLCNGEQAYPAMLAAIDAAAGYVYMSTYIFKGGQSGKAFADALGRAAKRGVDVRLIVDGMGGSLYSWDKPWKKLHRTGVKVKRFLPPKLIPPALSVNLRTHRKVLVCDGIVSFIGGMNIGDHHLVELPGKGKVQDIHFRCEGLISIMLQEAFLMDWSFLTKRKSIPPPVTPVRKGDSMCRLVFDGLGKGREDIHDLLCGVIGGADKRVCIMTPYFLPPRELASALISAALRGVEVTLILPAVNNLTYVHRASLHMQPRLVRKGVRILFQPAPFAHTKLLLVDDYYAMVGSANLDPRSLFLNFELNMEIFDPAFCATLHEYFAQVCARAYEVDEAFYKRRSLSNRLLDAAFWLFSPYL